MSNESRISAQREPIVVPSEWNGPVGSANGGIAAGLLAAHIGGAVRVRLYRPPPLDTPIAVVPVGTGFEARVGDEVVMSAEPDTVDVEPPFVTREQASAATAPFIGHTAVTCFVCGPERERGLCLFPGPVEGGPVDATVWTPGEWVADDAGRVPDEIVWGALDCPGAIVVAHAYPGEFFPALGTMTAEIREPIVAGRTYTVVAWPRGRDGRKLLAGTALTHADGTVAAVSAQICIAMPAEWGGSG